MPGKEPVINGEMIEEYLTYQREQERSKATLQKYKHDLYALMKFLDGAELTKTALIEWKEQLIGIYAPASVNAVLAAVNGYLRYMGWMELTVKPLKIQRSLFLEEEKELTRNEYVRLVRAAQMEENESVLKGMNFLCAEDNELNAEILKEILHMYDAECTIYPNGEEIVQAFKSVKPGEYDAILMDIQMPKMNGLDATRAIRAGSNPLGKTIPIIAMTANAFSEDVQHCIGAGMDAHIAKPLEIAVLERTLRGLASGGQIARRRNN